MAGDEGVLPPCRVQGRTATCWQDDEPLVADDDALRHDWGGKKERLR